MAEDCKIIMVHGHLSLGLADLRVNLVTGVLFFEFSFNHGKGYCALINMPGPPVTSALRLFRADFEHHLHHGSCP